MHIKVYPVETKPDVDRLLLDLDLKPVVVIPDVKPGSQKPKDKSSNRKAPKKMKPYVEQEPPLSFMDSLMGNIKPLVFVDRVESPSPCNSPVSMSTQK